MVRCVVAVGATAPRCKEARLTFLPKAGVRLTTAWLTVNARVGSCESLRRWKVHADNMIARFLQVRPSVPALDGALVVFCSAGRRCYRTRHQEALFECLGTATDWVVGQSPKDVMPSEPGCALRRSPACAGGTSRGSGRLNVQSGHGECVSLGVATSTRPW